MVLSFELRNPGKPECFLILDTGYSILDSGYSMQVAVVAAWSVIRDASCVMRIAYSGALIKRRL